MYYLAAVFIVTLTSSHAEQNAKSSGAFVPAATISKPGDRPPSRPPSSNVEQDRPRLDEFLSRIGATHVDPEVIQTDFLPLALGNTWVYTKSVPGGKRAFFQRRLPKKGGDLVSTGGMLGVGGALNCMEQYEIVAETGKGQWEIRITCTPFDSKSKFSGPRDGRYNNAFQVLWSKDIFGSPGVPSLNKELLGYINEDIVYDWESLPQGHREHVIVPAQEKRIVALIPKVVLPPGNGFFTHSIETVGTNVKLVGSDEAVNVVTRGGFFTNCVEAKEEVLITEPADKNSPWKNGWTTHRYFCPGVGLVKEVQKDNLGGTNYTMELVSYHVGQDELHQDGTAIELIITQLARQGKTRDSIQQYQHLFTSTRKHSHKLLLKILTGSLRNTNSSIRINAVSVMSTYKVREAIPFLLEAEKAESDPLVKEQVGKALKSIDAKEGPDDPTQKSVTKEEVRNVSMELTNRDRTTRWMAAASLRQFRNTPEVVRVARVALQNADSMVRAMAALTLGDQKAKDAITDLEAALNDPSVFVALSAVAAIWKLTE